MAQAGTRAKARAYRLLHLLGSGGMGDVYLAEEAARVPRPRQFALRIASDPLAGDERHMTRIQKVALALGWVHHPAIHVFESVTRIDGRWTLVQEFVDGATVSDLLAGTYPPPSVALEIAERVARGLAAVRKTTDRKGRPLKLIHRDIKPSNVLVTRGGEVRLLDFGIARKEFVPEDAARGERSFGTLAYQAPERSRSADTHAVDIYGLGMTLVAMLLGGTPDGQPGPLDPARHDDRVHQLDNMLAAQSAPVGIRMLVRRAIATDPRQRPDAHTFALVCNRLRSKGGGQPLPAWAEPRVTGLVRNRARPTGPLTGQVIEDTTPRLPSGRSSTRAAAYSIIQEPDPASATPMSVSSLPATEREESLPRARREALQRNNGANRGITLTGTAPRPTTPPPSPVSRAPAPRASKAPPRPRSTKPLAPLSKPPPIDTPGGAPSLAAPMPAASVLDAPTELATKVTKQLPPGRSRTPSLGASLPLQLDESVADPATEIRPAWAALPEGFGLDHGPQETTVIQKEFSPSIFHQLDTREMAPPREDAPGESTLVDPEFGDDGELYPPPRRRWVLPAAGAAVVAVFGLLIFGGISAFLGGSAAFGRIVMSQVSATPEGRCSTNVEIGREFVQQARLRPRRDALSLLDDLQGECVAGRIGVWGTVRVIVELRNRGRDGILTDYEQGKVTQVMRDWSE